MPEKEDPWAAIIEQYENLDGKEGGRLRHKRCGHIITMAVLNRENLEFLWHHAENCDGE